MNICAIKHISQQTQPAGMQHKIQLRLTRLPICFFFLPFYVQTLKW